MSIYKEFTRYTEEFKQMRILYDANKKTILFV